jgi:hypothetical protein
MKYSIRQRSYIFARKLGVHIQPSVKAFKKIDVYRPNPKKKGEFIYSCSIGDRRYMDFHLWKTLEDRGKVPLGTAEKRRKAYYSRHINDLRKKHSPGYFAWWLLWN